MRPSVIAAALVLCISVAGPRSAAALEIGQSAPAFEVRYDDAKVLRSQDLAGSVVVMTFEARDTIAINQSFKDALLKTFPAAERERLKIAVVPVVACFHYPWPGKGLCARGVQDSVKEVRLQLYVDVTGDAFRDYGARTDTSTVVIIDRAGVVRCVMAGKIADVGPVVELVRSLAGPQQE